MFHVKSIWCNHVLEAPFTGNFQIITDTSFRSSNKNLTTHPILNCPTSDQAILSLKLVDGS